MFDDPRRLYFFFDYISHNAYLAWTRVGALAFDPSINVRLSAVEALAQALDHDETSLTVADIQWARFAPAFSAARVRPLLHDLPDAQRALEQNSETPSPSSADSPLPDKLQHAAAIVAPLHLRSKASQTIHEPENERFCRRGYGTNAVRSKLMRAMSHSSAAVRAE